MFGLQLASRRASAPSHLRGNKLTQMDMARTQSLRMRRVNEIRSSRTRLPDYQPRHVYRLAEDGEPQATALFFSHSKVLRGGQPRKSQPPQGLMVEPSASEGSRREQQESKQRQKEKIYFYSSNLDQNSNLYMNRLLNRSEHDRKERLRQLQEQAQLASVSKANSNRTQNYFWRRMRKSLSRHDTANPSKTTRYT